MDNGTQQQENDDVLFAHAIYSVMDGDEQKKRTIERKTEKKIMEKKGKKALN